MWRGLPSRIVGHAAAGPFDGLLYRRDRGKVAPDARWSSPGGESMEDFSDYIGKRCDSSDAFERSLFGELVHRLRLLREQGLQIEPYRASSWLLPVVTVVVIVIVYFAYVYAAF
jgi:hypothetical protein